MSTLHLVPPDIQHLYHVKEWRNAAGVLATACPAEWADLIDVLREFRLLRSEAESSVDPTRDEWTTVHEGPQIGCFVAPSLSA
jgi:hypothetical protein